MRPKDLKSPFSFLERRSHLHDGILYVPPHYDEHHLYDMPSFSAVFENDNPVLVEYCSGNGDWIIQKALEHPEYNWIAVEKLYDRVKKIWSKRGNLGLKNLLIVSGEALTFTKFYVADKSIHSFYVNFPDPWPKDRHAKHRLIQAPFLSEIARVSQDVAKLTVVTDDEAYKGQVILEAHQHPSWRSIYQEPYFVKEMEGYGGSYFKELWEKKGKVIHYMTFCYKGENSVS